MTDSDDQPTKEWLERVKDHDQPFVVAKGEATYKITVEKMTPE